MYKLWVIMLSVGICLFFVSLILCVVFNVPDLIDELSGHKAKRQIKRLKELNISTDFLNDVSTSDIYKSISSGSLVEQEENKLIFSKEGLPKFENSNINEEFTPENIKDKTTVLDAEEVATTILQLDSPEDGSVVEGEISEEDIPTSDLGEFSSYSAKNITILEEQTSLQKGE